MYLEAAGSVSLAFEPSGVWAIFPDGSLKPVTVAQASAYLRVSFLITDEQYSQMNQVAEGPEEAQKLFKRAYDLEEEGKENEAYVLYTEAAEAGSAGAMNKLGILLQFSEKFRNKALAFTYFQQAAGLGNKFAMVNLAECYEAGCGTDKDEALAI